MLTRPVPGSCVRPGRLPLQVPSTAHSHGRGSRVAGPQAPRRSGGERLIERKGCTVRRASTAALRRAEPACHHDSIFGRRRISPDPQARPLKFSARSVALSASGVSPIGAQPGRSFQHPFRAPRGTAPGGLRFRACRSVLATLRQPARFRALRLPRLAASRICQGDLVVRHLFHLRVELATQDGDARRVPGQEDSAQVQALLVGCRPVQRLDPS